MSMLNLVSLLGLFAMIGIAWYLSSHRGKVNWRLVGIGVVMQLVFAAVFFNSQSWTFDRDFSDFDSLYEACEAEEIDANNVNLNRGVGNDAISFGAEFEKLKKPAFQDLWEDKFPTTDSLTVPRFKNGVVFYVIESFFDVIKRSVDEGAKFVFNVHAFPEEGERATKTALLSTFAFGVLPTVIFFASLMSILYYLGVMQKLIRGMAFVMQKTLGTSPSESLAAAANVLVGHTEAPLVVKPYVATMTRSELNALMVGGFATISGSLMAIFAGLPGVSAGHLLTASIISAPAALVLAKILQPETEKVTPLNVAESRMDSSAVNIIEAAANGASEGMKLAINIAAMLIAFLALIMFVDILLQGFGKLIGMELTIAMVFGFVFAPLAWLMGITPDDCLVAGDLLGQKMVVNEFLAYLSMADVPVQGNAPDKAAITERTRVILTYALCGFSNFGAIGIQIGGIGPLAPERKGDLAQLGLRAMFGGMLAACMTACIAGMFYGLLG